MVARRPGGAMLLLIWAAQAAWGFQVGGRFVGFPKAGRVGFWRRSATVAPLADDPPFRIGHGFDIHRLEPGRAGSWEQRFSGSCSLMEFMC